MKKISILFILLAALCLHSCSSTQDNPDNPEPAPSLVGINFGGTNGTWQDAPTSRASETGLEKLYSSFRVWGYKNTSADLSTPQLVMDGYQVNYQQNTSGTTTSNTADWEYVGIKNPNQSTTQTLKYWDYSASAYRFFAYTPANAQISTHQSEDNTTPSNNVFQIPFSYSKDATEKSITYISDLWFSDNAATTDTPPYGKCVTLRFSPLIAKVRFKFSYPANTKKIAITNIQFRDSRFISDPSKANTPLKGTISATYPMTGKPTSSTPLFSWKASAEADATGFIILDTPYETESDAIHVLQDPKEYGKWYYVPPFNIMKGTDAAGESYQQGPYTITATIDGNHTSATIPAEYMQWKAGYQYTYIFKITEAGTLISFSDLQVEEWLPGNNIDNQGNGTAGW